MCTRGQIELDHLSPVQWEHIKQSVMRRAKEARAQALRALLAAFLRALGAMTKSGWTAMRAFGARAAIAAANGWTAYTTGRDRRRAVSELGALDDRLLKDMGLHRSEIESVIYDCEPAPAKERAVTAMRPRTPPGTKPNRGLRTDTIDRAA